MFNLGLAAAAPAGGGWTSNLLFFGVMIAIFYFLLIRPQKKRQKQRTNMLSALNKNDKVVTIGGIYGTIVEIAEDKVTLRVNESTKLTFDKNAINSVINED